MPDVQAVEPEIETRLSCDRVLTAEGVARMAGVQVIGAGRSCGKLLVRQAAGRIVFASGLRLHYARELQIERMETVAQVQPGLSIKLFLEGAVRAQLGETPLPMPVRDEDGRWRPAAMITASRGVLPFRRAAARGAHLSKVVIDIPFDWAERVLPGAGAGSLGRAALPEAGAVVLPWTPGARALLLAQSLFDRPGCREPGPGLDALYLESVALGLVWEAFSQIESPAASPAAAVVAQEDGARLNALLTLVDSHPGGPLRLEVLADQLGSSVWTLQRLVQRVKGQTLSAFIRDHRLGRARDALVLGRAGLSQIAWDAGYSSPANFTTAFRRQYGMAPSALRASLAAP